MTRRSDARLIDANLNRCAEGLRTLEDIARFVLDDAPSVSRLKHARHAIAAAADNAGWDSLQRCAARDAEEDVGKAVSGTGEVSRAHLSDIAHAAAGRATQALRVLEEFAKLNSVEAAQRIEQQRYAVYDLASAIALALGTGRARQWALCVLITESACAELPWDRVAALACEGGADCLQLREPELPDRELLRRAQRAVSMAREHHASVFINNRPEVALLAGAHGVHVGQADLPVRAVRELVGSRLLIGVSTASLEQARAAASQGADVCGVGPMFPSSTKPKDQLAGPEYLEAFLNEPACARLPHLAISGINADNLQQLVSVGCRGVAVCAPVCGSGDPKGSAAELRSMLPESEVDSSHDG